MGWLDIALALSVLLAALQRNSPMLRTASALLGCLVVNRLHFLITGEYVPWAWYLVIDTLTAAVVLTRPAGKVQAIIGTTYLAEIAFHVAYGIYLSRNGYQYPVALSYWRILYGVAILQAILIGGWTAHGMARRTRGGRSLFHRRLPMSTHRAGVV